MKQKITVIGLGYIGLPTAVMFATHGYQVHGVDINKKTVEMLNNKELHIEEPGLLEKLLNVLDDGTLTISCEPVCSDIFILAVPSPINDDKSPNLSYVKEATESIACYITKGNLIVLESTVPPNTVKNIVIPALNSTDLIVGEEIFVSHSPERVIPGNLFEELVKNDRIVGGINKKSSELTVQLYKAFVKGKIHVTDATTAELVKVIENTYRDINIAFANELAKISDQIDVNVWEAINLANYHPRVNIHKPGPGVGGHCIAVDPWFLVHSAPELSNIIRLARGVNDSMPQYTVNKIQEIILENGIINPKIAVLGLAFKANIDDMRESPSLKIVNLMENSELDYMVYDPFIKENKLHFQTQNIKEAIDYADLLVILTDHAQFSELNPLEIKSYMRSPIIFDTKNCINKSLWENAGFTSYTLGDSKKNNE